MSFGKLNIKTLTTNFICNFFFSSLLDYNHFICKGQTNQLKLMETWSLVSSKKLFS